MKRFIIVEPHDEICSLMLRMLSLAIDDAGEAIAISSLETATEKVTRYEGVTMVFVAYGAPSGKGGRVAQEIKKGYPGAKVILTSTADFARWEAEILGLDGFLSKEDFCPPGKLRDFIKSHGVEL